MKQYLNYDEILTCWYDKVTKKADILINQSERMKIGSPDFLKHRQYAEGMYMALAMLSNEERKALNRLKNKLSKEPDIKTLDITTKEVFIQNKNENETFFEDDLTPQLYYMSCHHPVGDANLQKLSFNYCPFCGQKLSNQSTHKF